jgi:hypothetical protein
VAYPNANNLKSAGILSALWTDITPYRPLIQYAHGLHQDLRRALPMPVPPISQPVQQKMTPADITQIIADTNRRNAPARLSLSPLQTNQIRGYWGRTDPAYDYEELLEFYEGLAFVSKTDADIRLYIDAFVSGEDWHGHIVGAPELVITKKKLDVIKNVSPQRSGRDYSECHLGLTPMAAPIMSREAVVAMLEEKDSVERSLVRSAADVAKSKIKPPFFPKTVDELMGWLANWQLVLFMQYGPLCLEYEQARALAHG